MKKQINPTIKAHLIRGAFYLVLLLAVCAIPFALAQRHSTKRSSSQRNGASAVKLAAALNPDTAHPPAGVQASARGSFVPKVANSLFGHHTGVGKSDSRGHLCRPQLIPRNRRQ
jgi:hypothetical protein